MSPVPCYLSSCSVDLSTDPLTGQLVADARLADTGSLDCVDRDDPDETDGVFVKVSGLTDDATSGVEPEDVPCGQSIGRDNAGNLFAYPEGAVVIEYEGLDDTHPFADDTNYNAHVNVEEIRYHDVLITNPFDCEAYCHYKMSEMKIMGGRRPDAAGSPAGDWPGHTGGESFYVIGYFNLQIGDFDGGGPATAPLDGDAYDEHNHRFDIHGSWSGEGNAPNHQKGHAMDALFKLAAGGVTIVRNRIVIARRYHFAMGGVSPADPDQLNNVGIAMVHPAATFWRVDSRP